MNRPYMLMVLFAVIIVFYGCDEKETEKPKAPEAPAPEPKAKEPATTEPEEETTKTEETPVLGLPEFLQHHKRQQVRQRNVSGRSSLSHPTGQRYNRQRWVVRRGHVSGRSSLFDPLGQRYRYNRQRWVRRQRD